LSSAARGGPSAKLRSFRREPAPRATPRPAPRARRSTYFPRLPSVAHRHSRAGPCVDDGPALVGAAHGQREVRRDLVANLRDGACANVAPDAGGLVRHLAPEKDRDAPDGSPFELDDAAQTHGAQDLTPDQEVRAQIAPDAHERLRAARNTTFAEPQD